MDPKAWYASKAIWGGIITLVATLVSAAFGITVSADDQAALVTTISTLATAIGGLLAIIGRLRASRPIGKTKKPKGGGGMSAPRIVAPALVLLLIGASLATLSACASRVPDTTPAQSVFAIQEDLNALLPTALAFVHSDQASPQAKEAVKRLAGAAADSVKAAQQAVRAGNGPAIPAAAAAARNAVDALAHYLAEGTAR